MKIGPPAANMVGGPPTKDQASYRPQNAVLMPWTQFAQMLASLPRTVTAGLERAQKEHDPFRTRVRCSAEAALASSKASATTKHCLHAAALAPTATFGLS